MSTPTKRTHSRSQLDKPVFFSDPRNGKYFKGRMCNCGCEGMYLESAQPIDPGVEILIRMKKANPTDKLCNDTTETYLAEVKWCEPLLKEVPPRYGIGLCQKVCSHMVHEGVQAGNHGNDCDLCKEMIYEGRMHEIHDGIWLCSKCFIYLESLDELTREGIESMLIGNVI